MGLEINQNLAQADLERIAYNRWRINLYVAIGDPLTQEQLEMDESKHRELYEQVRNSKEVPDACAY